MSALVALALIGLLMIGLQVFAAGDADGTPQVNEDFKIYISGTEIDEFKSHTLPTEFDRVDVSRRSDAGWKRDKKRLKRFNLNGTLLYRAGETIQRTLLNAMIADTDLTVRIVRTADSAEVVGSFGVGKVDETAEDGAEYAVELYSQGAITVINGS
jgi:hypothetical protein